MRRRLVHAVLATALGATATGMTGLIHAGAASIPPACVTQPVGPTQIEVGYCPDGPTQPVVPGT